MRILSSRISHARRLRDFGCVEAMITLLVKAEGRPVPYETRILTSVPIHAAGDAPLRERLLASARLLHKAQVPGTCVRPTSLRRAA